MKKQILTIAIMAGFYMSLPQSYFELVLKDSTPPTHGWEAPNGKKSKRYHYSDIDQAEKDAWKHYCTPRPTNEECRDNRHRWQK